MPRRARLSIAGIPWHIIQRGNNRSACFYSEEDYLFYLEQLLQQSKTFGCAIHAYCLMTNHVHILLTPGYLIIPLRKAYSNDSGCNKRKLYLWR